MRCLTASPFCRAGGDDEFDRQLRRYCRFLPIFGGGYFCRFRYEPRFRRRQRILLPRRSRIEMVAYRFFAHRGEYLGGAVRRHVGERRKLYRIGGRKLRMDRGAFASNCGVLLSAALLRLVRLWHCIKTQKLFKGRFPLR